MGHATMTAAAMLLAAASAAAAAPRAFRPFGGVRASKGSAAAPVGRPSSANCTLDWHEQNLDHFSWVAGPGGQTTYKERVFTCGQDNWKPPSEAFARAFPDAVYTAGAADAVKDATCGPVFFYTGNEADVTL